MSIYLVDYENVNIHGLDGVSKLGDGDEVYIFYTDNSDRLSFGIHKKLNETKATVNYRRVETPTKNALDFQLSSFLGYLIATKPRDQEFIIVSKDKGFEALACYWKKQKVVVRFAPNCIKSAEEKAETAAAEKVKPEETPKNEAPSESKHDLIEIEKLVGSREDAEIVLKTIDNYETKQEINAALVKQLKDSDKAGRIYRSIKSLLKDKKGQ